MREKWPLLLNDGQHEAQAREFLEFLSLIYGDDFAVEAANKACRAAIDDGDNQGRVVHVYQALRWPLPNYVAEHDRERRRIGREPASSGQRQMAKRLKPWFKKWADRSTSSIVRGRSSNEIPRRQQSSDHVVWPR